MIDSLPARISDKIHMEPNTGCWLWGGCTRYGYGAVRWAGKTSLLHRVVWGEVNGPIPAGLCVLHKCDVRACVNPDHLFLGTHGDNVRDKVAKARQHRGESHGGARLSEAAVASLRERYAGGESQRALAAEFGIHQSSVSLVCSRRRWAHVP